MLRSHLENPGCVIESLCVSAYCSISDFDDIADAMNKEGKRPFISVKHLTLRGQFGFTLDYDGATTLGCLIDAFEKLETLVLEGFRLESDSGEQDLADMLNHRIKDLGVLVLKDISKIVFPDDDSDTEVEEGEGEGEGEGEDEDEEDDDDEEEVDVVGEVNDEEVELDAVAALLARVHKFDAGETVVGKLHGPFKCLARKDLAEGSHPWLKTHVLFPLTHIQDPQMVPNWISNNLLQSTFLRKINKILNEEYLGRGDEFDVVKEILDLQFQRVKYMASVRPLCQDMEVAAEAKATKKRPADPNDNNKRGGKKQAC